MPGSFTLEPNYPHPLNPGTTTPFVIGVIPSLGFYFLLKPLSKVLKSLSQNNS